MMSGYKRRARSDNQFEFILVILLGSTLYAHSMA
jgi:hypothetical protein